MSDLLPKRYRKALRGELDVKSRNAPAPLTTIPNPDIPKWDYKTGGYTRSIDEQESYMKEKAQKKSDKKFKEEAGFGDYALELGGYASAAYLYFKLPKIGSLAGKAIKGIGKFNKANRKPQKLFDTTRMPKTQRLFHLENIVSKNAKEPRMWWEGKVANKEGLQLLRNREAKTKRAYVLRSLLTGPGADKLEKDLLKKGKPTATEKLFLKGKQSLLKQQQKGEIITKKEIKSKGKTKLLKEQNRGFGNMTRTIKSKSKYPEVTQKMTEIRERDRGKVIKASVKETGGKLPQFQTKSKQSLLTNQPVKSKGGGKSAGGGGGKYGIINRALGGRSPWHHLKRLLE